MRFEKLEALRGFAAFYIVLHHSLPHFVIVGGINVGTLFRFGQEAVILFFLLSGFVINHSFQRARNKSFRTFFLKRFSRIFIPLLIIMLLGYVIESIRYGSMMDLEIKHLLLNLLMLQDIGALKPNVIVEPYMHNSPLWSLSYEWWFYMLFYVYQTKIQSERNRDFLVFGLAIGSALIYQLYPDFVPRLLMYMSIWWAGVCLSQLYSSDSTMSIRALRVPLISLLIINIILGFQVYVFFSSGETASIGVHPWLEMRHHLFALLVVFLALYWRKFKWMFFDSIFKPFVFLAPMSYVLYISHHYFVVDAQYLTFMNNRTVEWIGYVLVALCFSWLLEVVIYPRLQKVFLNATIAKR